MNVRISDGNNASQNESPITNIVDALYEDAADIAVAVVYGVENLGRHVGWQPATRRGNPPNHRTLDPLSI